MKKPDLLVLTSTFPRWLGDSQPPFVYELSKRLGNIFSVTVIAPRSPGSLDHELLHNVHVIRFGYFFKRLENLATHGGGILYKLNSNPFYYLLLPSFVLFQLITLIRFLRDKNVDVIHAHWLIPQGLIAFLACRLTRRRLPVVCTSHGGDLYALNGRLLNTLKKWIINKSWHLTVVSSSMRASVISMGIPSDNVSVIPMGVDLQTHFIPNRTIKRKFPVLLFVGRLVEKKGAGILIDALPALLKQYPDLTLKIIGDGPLGDALRLKTKKLGVHDHCHFLGMICQDNLPSQFNEATILVAPFQIAKGGDQEGLGLVLVEAAGCECPVIAGDVPAVHDVIVNDVNGILIKSGSTGEIVKAIHNLLADPAKLAALGTSARSFCLKRFDWEIVAARYSKLLLSACNRDIILSEDPEV